MRTADTQPKAFSYLRFSTPDQMRGDSFRRQTELAESYAKQHGFELDQGLTLQDLGVSAFRGKNAATGALRRFLDAVESGMVPPGSYLLVESLDRISRDQILAAQGLFLQIIQAGITLVTLQDQRAYSVESINNNPIDLILSIVVMMRAHDESAAKSRRLKSVWTHKRRELTNANRKAVMTKRCPAWLRVAGLPGTAGFEVVEDRAELVRRIFAMTLEGRGQYAVAEQFNREGIPTWGDSGGARRAKHWHRSYIAKIIDSPTVIGTLVPHEVEYVAGRKRRRPLESVPGYYPSVVDPESYARVRAMRDGSKPQARGRHASAPVRNILAGLARCPACGDTMTRVSKGSRTRSGQPYLVCTRAKAGAGCDYRTVRMERVEAAMVEAAKRVLIDAMPANGAADPKLEARRQEFQETWASLDLRIEELLEDMRRQRRTGRSRVLRDELIRMEEERETAARELGRVMGQIETGRGPYLRKRLLNVAQGVASGDIGTANRALREALDRVEVRYDDNELRLHWQHGIETVVSL